MDTHRTVVGGCSINWVDEGAGDPPFLLVHGWGSSIAKWLDPIPMLATQRRTIALDLPGFGLSDIVAGTYSPGWLAGAVRGFMDEAGIPRAILVGNSLGGLISMYVGAAWPERVAGLVLVDPALPNDGPRPPLRDLAVHAAPVIPVVGEFVYGRYVMSRAAEQLVAEGLRRNFADPSRLSDGTRRALLDEAARRKQTPEHIVPVVRANRRMMWALTGGRERTWRIARSLRAPTLLVWGDSDRLVPVGVGERAVREIPGSQLVVIEDCGHNPQIEKPEEFAATVLTFARALGDRAPVR